MKSIIKITLVVHALFGFYACARVVYESIGPSTPRLFFAHYDSPGMRRTMALYEPKRLFRKKHENKNASPLG